MTFYKITLYNHALRNVPYVIYIALYEVHSTRNNDTLQKYALQTRSTYMYSTWLLLRSTKYTLHGIMSLYKITLYKLPPTWRTLRITLYTE